MKPRQARAVKPLLESAPLTQEDIDVWYGAIKRTRAVDGLLRYSLCERYLAADRRDAEIMLTFGGWSSGPRWLYPYKQLCMATVGLTVRWLRKTESSVARGRDLFYFA